MSHYAYRAKSYITDKGDEKFLLQYKSVEFDGPWEDTMYRGMSRREAINSVKRAFNEQKLQEVIRELKNEYVSEIITIEDIEKEDQQNQNS